MIHINISHYKKEKSFFKNFVLGISDSCRYYKKQETHHKDESMQEPQATANGSNQSEV